VARKPHKVYLLSVCSNKTCNLYQQVRSTYVNDKIGTVEYQVGFKHGHSTSLCTHSFKHIVEYYTSRGSHVFVCFADFSKAFDRVNYWKLFKQLIDNGLSAKIVSLLAFWYSHQQVCVQWHSKTSASFHVGNGTKQGGVLSPCLFNCYVSKLIMKITASNIGCNTGGVPANILAYADDMVLMAPS